MGTQAITVINTFVLQEKITYIGIAVIFGLIIVLVVVAIGVIIKLRSMRRRIQVNIPLKLAIKSPDLYTNVT